MLIIGTAGHIDHGKTSLVGALTGIRTDRLKEEQARGISIELGFAYIDLDGARCGIVDVPGHERFIRQMIAGASGIDVVMLVIAADEGVMQQTREHLDVCRLLGITDGFVVLSKVDLVDADWLELVESDVAEFVRGTFLEGAPIVRYSLSQPESFGAIRAELERRAVAVRNRPATSRHVQADLPFRLPVDRAFSLRGFGTIVTGTVASGFLAPGEAVTLLPSGHSAKVRGIESHGSPATLVSAGRRAAVNLQGLEKDDVERGEVLVRTGSLDSTSMLDLDLFLLPHVGKLLETRAKALVHIGTAQVTATLVLLDTDVMEPGETRPVQLRLDRPVVALGGDRVVLRGFEHLDHYGTTFGGGRVLHPCPRKHKAHDDGVLSALASLRAGATLDAARVCVDLAGLTGLTDRLLAQVVGCSLVAATALATALLASGAAFSVTEDGVRRLLPTGPFEALMSKALDHVSDYHARWPHRAGVPKGELRTQIWADLSPRLFAEVLAVLAERGRIAPAERTVRRIDFAPRLSTSLLAARDGVLAALDSGGYTTPSAEELTAALAPRKVTAHDVLEVIELLVDEGQVSKLDGGLLFHKRHIDALVERVTSWIREHGELTTADLKELTGASRKYSVPLGEHLDALRVTARYGDVRRLRGG